MKLYDFNMDARYKVFLFRLIHLALVVRLPDGPTFTASQHNSMDEGEVKQWSQHFRTMYSIVEREIKGLSRQLGAKNKNLCPVLVRMAARTCAAVRKKYSIFRIYF